MVYRCSCKLVSTSLIFAAAVGLFFVGLSTGKSEFYYASGSVSVLSLGIFCVITYKMRHAAPIFEAPPQPIRIYTDPGMKRNKSDTNLELIQK
jgi:hypothetical protein